MEEEYGTRSAKLRGVGKGNKKADKDACAVAQGEATEEGFCVKYDDLECEKAFIGTRRELNKPGTSTTTIREDCLQGMRKITAENNKDYLAIDAGPNVIERSTDINEEGVYKSIETPAGDNGRRKGEGAKEFCTSVNLLAKEAVSRDGDVSSYVRLKSSKGKTFIRPEADNEITSMRKCQLPFNQMKDKDLSPGCELQDNLQSATQYSMIQGKDALTSYHPGDVYRRNVPEGLSETFSLKKKQLQSQTPRSYQHFTNAFSNDRASTSNGYDPLLKVLFHRKMRAKNQEKCFNNEKSKTIDNRPGMLLRAQDNHRREMLSRTIAQGPIAINCFNGTKKEASTNKNKILMCPIKGNAGTSTNHCSVKCCCGKGLVADNCFIASTEKKRKAANVMEHGKCCKRSDSQNTLNLKRHRTDVIDMKNTKKERCNQQIALPSHSSASLPDDAFFLVSSKDESLATADHRRSDSEIKSQDISFNGYFRRIEADSKWKSHRGKTCETDTTKHLGKQAATVRLLFDEIDRLVLNKARTDPASKKTHTNQPQNCLGFVEGTTFPALSGNKISQGALICSGRHGKRPLIQEQTARNINKDSSPKRSPTAKIQSSCYQSDNISVLCHGEGSKCEQRCKRSQDVKLTKGTFDLATVFYERTGEQGCSDDDCRITSVKAKAVKGRAESNRHMPILKRLLVADYSAKERDIDCANSRAKRKQGFNVDRAFDMLNKPSTSKHCFNSSINTEFEGTTKDIGYHATPMKGNSFSMVSQQRTFIDALMAASATAKPPRSNDQVNLSFLKGAHTEAKGTKRKSSTERSNCKSLKKTFTDFNNSKRYFGAPGEQRPLKRDSIGRSHESDNNCLDRTRHLAFVAKGDDQQIGPTSTRAVIPRAPFPSSHCADNEFQEERRSFNSSRTLENSKL